MMLINWGPVSEWVLVVLVFLSELYYLIDHKKSKGEKEMKVLTPKNSVIMVLRDEVKAKKVGSLYIADQSIELANEGEVRAVNEKSEYEVGDRVVFTKYAGSEIDLNGVTYLLLPEKDVQGKIHEVPDSSDEQPAGPEDLALAIAAFDRTQGPGPTGA